MRLFKNKKNSRAQALLELTLLMTLFVFIMGSLMRVGMSSISRQRFMMDAFRDGLKKASATDFAKSTVSYSGEYHYDVGIYDPGNPHGSVTMTELVHSVDVTRSVYKAYPRQANRFGVSRKQYLINKDSDGEFKSIDNPVADGDDGFTTQGYKSDQSLPQIDPSDSESNYLIIRKLNDPFDCFYSDGTIVTSIDPATDKCNGDGIFWNWVAFEIPKDHGFTCMGKSNNPDGDPEKTYMRCYGSEEKMGESLPTGAVIYSLGIDIEAALENPGTWVEIEPENLFENLSSQSILTTGMEIYLPDAYIDSNPDFRTNLINGKSERDVIKERGNVVNIGSLCENKKFYENNVYWSCGRNSVRSEKRDGVTYYYYPLDSIDFASSLWGDLDFGGTEPVAMQGIKHYTAESTSDNVFETVKEDGTITTKTKMNQTDKIRRTLYTNPYGDADWAGQYEEEFEAEYRTQGPKYEYTVTD